jgi:hypothetical protein
MDHALVCLRDALHVLTAATAVSNSPLKETLTREALSAADTATLELRRYLQPSPIPPQEVSVVELPEPDAEQPRRYQEFVAAMVPILRNTYPDNTQQQHIARIGQLWQQHKSAATLLAAVTAASLSLPARTA